MNMKWYWTKIGLVAGGIFLVGYAGIRAVRETRKQVVDMVETRADVTIPLPFVPFKFDGDRVGTFRKLVIHRSDPKRVSGVDLTVRLPDPASLDRFRHCHLTADDPTRINEQTSFRCVEFDSSMEGFGSLVVQTRAGGQWIDVATVPLALPVAVAKRIRGEPVEGYTPVLEANRLREIGDSLGVLGRALGRTISAAERAELEAQIDDLRGQLEEAQASLAQGTRRRGAAELELPPGSKADPPAPPKAPPHL